MNPSLNPPVRPCVPPSVRPLVRLSACRSVRPSVSTNNGSFNQGDDPNKSIAEDFAKSWRGARRFEGTFEKKHALVTQQDPGEELEEDSRTLLKGNMY